MGFWTETEQGRVIHIDGDPNMSKETRQVLCRLADEAVNMAVKKKELSPEELSTLTGFLANLEAGKKLEEIIDRYSAEGLDRVLRAVEKISRSIRRIGNRDVQITYSQ